MVIHLLQRNAGSLPAKEHELKRYTRSTNNSDVVKITVKVQTSELLGTARFRGTGLGGQDSMGKNV